MSKSNLDGAPKRKDDDCDMVTALQNTELSKNELCLHEAARTGNKELLDRILKKHAANFDCKNNIDRTALHMAASNGHKECVVALLDKNVTVDAADKYGMTPLMWAAYFGHLDVFNVLMDRKSNVNKRNKHGYDLIHIAAERDQYEIVDSLIRKYKHFKLDEADNTGSTPFLVAVTNNSYRMVTFILTKNCNFDAVDKTKKNAFHLAAKSGHAEILKLLMEANILKIVNNKDSEEYTPLYYAAENGHKEAVQILLEYNAEIDLECKNNMNPLLIATQKGYEDIAGLLLENGADISTVNEQGNSALHLAGLANLGSMVKFLIKNGANRFILNKRDQTALQAAVEQNKYESVEQLLLSCESVSELYTIDKTGKTPLLMAARSSYISMVDMIIKADRYLRKLEAIKNNTISNELSHDMSNGENFRPSDYYNVYNIHLEEIKSSANDKENFSLKEFNQPYAEEFKLYLWKIAFNHLRCGEWKKLAQFWNFQPEHLMAIEYHHVQNNSYKYHGYRLLCIWFHGVEMNDTPVRGLYEALVAIGRRKLADKIRRELDIQAHGGKGSHTHCTIS